MLKYHCSSVVCPRGPVSVSGRLLRAIGLKDRLNGKSFSLTMLMALFCITGHLRMRLWMYCIQAR